VLEDLDDGQRCTGKDGLDSSSWRGVELTGRVGFGSQGLGNVGGWRRLEGDGVDEPDTKGQDSSWRDNKVGADEGPPQGDGDVLVVQVEEELMVQALDILL